MVKRLLFFLCCLHLSLVAHEKTLTLSDESLNTLKVYLDNFLTQERIDRGLTFWQEHKKVFLEAEELYGIPPAYILAIINCESNYGLFLGRSRAAFAPLYGIITNLHRPLFFAKQLYYYFLLWQQGNFPFFATRSSEVGAIGIAQMMPSIWWDFGISYQNNEPLNIIDSVPDAIFSIANYLKRSGWKQNDPVIIAHDGSLIHWTIWPNFHALRIYNGATAYGIAIALIAERFTPLLQATVPPALEAASSL